MFHDVRIFKSFCLLQVPRNPATAPNTGGIIPPPAKSTKSHRAQCVLEISCQRALQLSPLAVGMIIQNYQASVALLSFTLMIQVFLALSLSFHHPHHYHHCIEYHKPLATIFVNIVSNKIRH
jgi:hypothetical protein